MLVVVGAGRRLAAVASNQLEAMLRRDATAAAAEMFQEEDGDASLSVSLEIQGRRHKTEEEDTANLPLERFFGAKDQQQSLAS